LWYSSPFPLVYGQIPLDISALATANEQLEAQLADAHQQLKTASEENGELALSLKELHASMAKVIMILLSARGVMWSASVP
jgi:enamine deaminase RidA (YjgF/YER057c/UK114 family)